MAFHALADYQNHVIGWLQWEQSSLGDGAVVRFPRIWMSSGECRIKRLLEEMNYQNVEVTAPSGDGGIDVVGDIELGITSVRVVVQVKRHRNAIQRQILDALRGSLHRFNAVRGTIITTSRFTKNTRNASFEEKASPVTLVDGDRLVDLLIEHGIGVRKRTIDLLEVDAEAFVAVEKDS